MLPLGQPQPSGEVTTFGEGPGGGAKAGKAAAVIGPMSGIVISRVRLDRA